jgi:hypothetical protein
MGIYLEMTHEHIKIGIQAGCLEKRLNKDFKHFENMFTPYLCRDIGEIPKWGYGASNIAHQSYKCDIKKK